MKKLLIACTIFINTECVIAQADVQNNGIVYITGSSDILYVNNSFNNTSAATLTNNGNLYVNETLTNAQASMSPGSGTLYLTGSAQQSVAGTQTFKTFNLITGNAAGFVLNNNLSVTGGHTFVSGIISSASATNFLVYEAGSSYSGDGDGSHVSGWVKKFGSTNFTFPVGNGTVERPVTISSLTANSEFNAHHYLSTQNTGNLLSPLVAVDPYEYWQINRVSGGNANVNMNWNVSKIAFPDYPLGSIRAGYYNAGLWTNYGGSAVGDPLIAGNITSTVMTTFGTFAIASISAALPLNFLGTYAYKKNGGTLVEWKTSNEVNVNHFEIERSTDGRTFASIGQVAAIFNSGNEIGNYTFTDKEAYQGKVYYRIRSVDNDGRFLFSRVVSVTDGQQANDLFTIVNPVLSRILINVSNLAAGSYNYQLRTDNGQSIQSGTLNITGSGSYSIPLTGKVTPGVYILTIGNLSFIDNEKLRIL